MNAIIGQSVEPERVDPVLPGKGHSFPNNPGGGSHAPFTWRGVSRPRCEGRRSCWDVAGCCPSAGSRPAARHSGRFVLNGRPAQHSQALPHRPGAWGSVGTSPSVTVTGLRTV